MQIGLLLSFSSLLVVSEASFRRIFNGSGATIEEFPYLIQIAQKVKGDSKFKCGGAIIGKNIVLTAGHCLKKGNEEDYVVRSGTTCKIGTGAMIHNVTKMVVHNLYHSEGKDHDVAVAHVDPPFEFDDTTQPIPVSVTAPETGDVAMLAGWGAISRNGQKKATILQSAEVPIKSQKDCIEETLWGDSILEDNLCAGGTSVSRRGDSGSPLTFDGKVIGLTSWGRSYYSEGYPGVIVNVAFYQDWIRSVVDSLNGTDVTFE